MQTNSIPIIVTIFSSSSAIQKDTPRTPFPKIANNAALESQIKREFKKIPVSPPPLIF
jgi:hypothetical protein